MAAAIPPKVSRVVDIFVSIAAAVVIWGALQKLLHTSWADFFLKLGLGTEALVFLVYGLLYLIYPAVDDHQVKIAGAQPQVGNPALKSDLPEMLLKPPMSALKLLIRPINWPLEGSVSASTLNVPLTGTS